MANKLKNFFSGLRKKQIAEAHVKPEQKPISFAELIDDCIKLVQTPNRVDVYVQYQYSIIKVCPFGKNWFFGISGGLDGDQYIFDIECFQASGHYLISFSAGPYYDTDEFGEADRVKKLYNLCLERAKETRARRSQESFDRNRANLTKAAQSVKQYM